MRRSAITGEHPATARVCDLGGVVGTLRGKVEFEAAEEGRELEVLVHLLRRATAEVFRARLAGSDLSGLLEHFSAGGTIITGDLVPAAELLREVGAVPGLSKLLERLGVAEGEESPGQAAAAIELALEGLHLQKKLSKDEAGGRAVYGA